MFETYPEDYGIHLEAQIRIPKIVYMEIWRICTKP